MPRIHFHKKNRPDLIVEKGCNLMMAILDSGLPVASSCHGEGVCAKCRMQIVDGMQNLSPINELEEFLLKQNSISDKFRISCQVQVLGDVTVDTTYW